MITKYIKEAINECLKKKKSVYDKQKFIEECISNAVGNFLVNETNAIRPWRDDDYQKVNPFQVGDVSDEAYRNAPEGSDNAFKEPIRQGEIDDYQRELTQRIRQRSNTTQQPIKDYYREFNNLGRYKAIGMIRLQNGQTKQMLVRQMMSILKRDGLTLLSEEAYSHMETRSYLGIQ